MNAKVLPSCPSATGASSPRPFFSTKSMSCCMAGLPRKCVEGVDVDPSRSHLRLQAALR